MFGHSDKQSQKKNYPAQTVFTISCSLFMEDAIYTVLSIPVYWDPHICTYACTCNKYACVCGQWRYTALYRGPGDVKLRRHASLHLSIALYWQRSLLIKPPPSIRRPTASPADTVSSRGSVGVASYSTFTILVKAVRVWERCPWFIFVSLLSC